MRYFGKITDDKDIVTKEFTKEFIEKGQYKDGVVTREKLAQNAIGTAIDWYAASSPITNDLNGYFIYMRSSEARSFTISANDVNTMPEGYTITILCAGKPVTFSWANGIKVIDAVQRNESSTGGSITLNSFGDEITLYRPPAGSSSVVVDLIITGKLNPCTFWSGTSAPATSLGQNGDVYIQYT